MDPFFEPQCFACTRFSQSEVVLCLSYVSVLDRPRTTLVKLNLQSVGVKHLRETKLQACKNPFRLLQDLTIVRLTDRMKDVHSYC